MLEENHSISCINYRSLFNNINNYRKTGTLCDVVLKLDGKEFYAHRIILSACSDYFCAMFTNEMKEKDLQVIELKGLSANTMELLLDCIYTEKVEFTTENVQELLPAACLLQLTDVQTACADFLQSQLDPTNCLGVKKFAESHGCTNLKNSAQEYIFENFAQVVQSEEFFYLEFNEIEELIKLDEIEILNEEIVYNAVFNWIRYDEDLRTKHLPDLLVHVRLPLLSPKFLTDICDNESLIKSSFECRDLLDEAKKYYLRPECRPDMNGTRFKIRSGKDENLVILGGFGFQQKPLDMVEKYSPRTNTWTSLPSLTKKRRYAAAAALGKRLYIIGGYDTKSRLRSVERLDISKEKPTWEVVAPMCFRRALPAVCVLDGKIYVVGGFDGQTRHSTMEYYNEETNTWSLLDCTSVSREGAGLVALCDSLYCIGGYDGVNLLRSVEKYDLSTSVWTLIAPMLIPRSGAGCAALNYRIFVCGGYDGHIHLPTVESYSIITGQWTNLCNMSIARCYCSATSLNKKIVVCGGYDGQSLLSTLEEYDEESDTWQIKTNMQTARCDAGFAVLKYRN